MADVIRALIVDDEKLVRQGMISIMPWKDYGIQVAGDVNSGEKALEFLGRNPAELLITDLAMPVMSGLELIRKVKALYPDIWIVVLTFHQDFDLVQEALRLGVIDYILKTQLEKEQMGDVLARIVSRIEKDKQLMKSKALSAQEGGAADGGTQSFYDYKRGSGACEPAPAEAQLREPPPAAADQDLAERWSSFQWVHDGEAFEALLSYTEGLRLDPARLAGALYTGRKAWERTLALIGTENTIEPPGQPLYWCDWVEWLRRVRAFLQEKTQKEAYSSDIAASVMKAIDIINRADEPDIKQETVARQVCMSRSYFSQCFKDITGKSFNDYVRSAKMEKAKVLLAQTNRPIYWIADQIGYMDEKHFSRVFHEQTGLLPTEYRSRMR